LATQNPATITVARVLRPHGRRGEVAAEILTDFPERLKLLKHAELCGGNAGADSSHRVAIRNSWFTQSRGGQAIFHFEGSDSISDAEKFVGLEVRIPFSERVALPAGSYYISDLIGCEVREKEAPLGAVRDVQFTGGTPLLVVDAAGQELLIPLAQEICVRVDIAARRIDAILPEGLRELNRN
jgi:16S rRNA processing protein RimM